MDVARFAEHQPHYPVYHQTKSPFRPRIRTPGSLQARLMEIRRIDGELDRHILRREDYFDLIAEAYATNFHYSTRLEGNDLDLEEVRRITRDSLQQRMPPTDNPPQTQEIINHILAANNPIFARHWTQDTVLALHQALMTGAEPESHPGQFKTAFNPITQDADVVFAPARPESVAAEIESLLTWLNEEGPAFHALVAATVFFHEFESIHPFRDGNGRTGRMLFQAYLQTHGLPNAHLCQFEKNLTGEPEVYYRLLSWTDETGDYRPLLDLFSEAVLLAYQEALEFFERKDLLSSGLDEHAKRILVQAKRHRDWFSVTEARQWVDNIGDQTVRKHLNRLVEAAALEDNGKATSGKRYRFATPFPDAPPKQA